MPQTGYVNFTSFAEGGTTWATESNAAASDDAYAVASGSAQDWLECENGSVAIQALVPSSNAIIRGIEVLVEASSATTRSMDVQLTKNGTAVVGALKNQALTASDVVYKLGSSTDLWGTTWTLADIRASTFGAFVRDDTATASDINVDHVAVKVYFDEGVRGVLDINYDGFAEFSTPRVTIIDGWLDYDGGTGGTAPAIGDVIRNATTGAIARIIRPSDMAVLLEGTLALGDLHDEDGGENSDPSPPYNNNDALTILDYVDFDTEQNNGLSESDIGTAVTGGTTSGAIIRHVENHGDVGRMWFTKSSGSFADTNAIQISGTTVALANGASVANAWTGNCEGTIYQDKQGYFDYDAEVTALEGVSGNERIRTSDFQHNMCVVASNHTHPKWTAMVVDDRPDANAPAEGRLYVYDIDDSTALANDDTVEALEEISFDTATGTFAINDLVQELASMPTKTARVRRLIDNGDNTGVLYVEMVTGAAWTDDEAIFVGMTQIATANGAQRVRVGQITVNETSGFISGTVQWMNSHVYTDIQDQAPVLVNTDDATPISAQVLDVQYTYLNQYTMSHFSTRRTKKGSVKQIGETGGADDDTVYTNYVSIQTLANNLSGSDPIAYVEQGANNALAKFWDDGLVSALIRNQEDNAKINSGSVTWYFREWGTLYTNVTITQVGGQPPITGDTFTDAANTTAESTVNTTAGYQDIRVSFASHLVEFDGGSGAMGLSDVLWNATRSSAAMVVRVPDSQISGTDLHVASDGQDITDWVDADALTVLARVDFDTVTTDADGNARIFAIGDAIDDGGVKSGTVRFVRQYGTGRGSIWITTGDTWANDDPIEVGATQYATADGAQVAGSGWTGNVHTSGAAADITVLKDIGNGTDNPYNVVVDLTTRAGNATVQQMYEQLKFITRRQAGAPSESGGVLYPNNTLTQGRFYQKADSAYGAADTNKQAPFGSKAAIAADFFGARGVFIENMAAADVQAYQLIDSDGTTRNPPNLQSAIINGLASGDTAAMYRRPTANENFTYNATAPATITRPSGDFLDDGFRGKTTITSDSTLNAGDYEVDTVVAATITLKTGETLTAETEVSTIEGHNVNRDQFSSDATGNNLGDGDFDTTAALPSDLPSSGTFIVVHKDGTEVAGGFYTDVYTYSSYTGEIFTLSAGTLVRTYDGDARAFVPMIYVITASTSESQQIIYSADFPTITRVRRKGIIPFEILGTFTSTGQTVAAIRQTDTIVE